MPASEQDVTSSGALGHERPPAAGSPRGPAIRAAVTAAVLVLFAAGAVAPAAANPAPAGGLPAEVAAALQRTRLPAEALSVVVQEAGSGRTVLSHLPQQPRNPASLIKLLTTYAALDQLGPAWQWSTAVATTGTLNDGVLEGDLHLRGSGDPTLVIEQLWLLLKRVQQAGVREVRGDIVLDRSAFAPPEGHPGDFDGEPWRPHNVHPDALLLNFKSIVYTFVPDAARGVARVRSEPDGLGPQPAGVATVPLAPGPCEDWRTTLKAVPAEGGGFRFTGRYPASCGELVWPLADPDPGRYGARLLQAAWREIGGRLGGSVREGPVPAQARPLIEHRSRALAEAVRDINKYSSNVMAQQLFLTLAAQRQPGQPASPETAREAMRRWLVERLGEPPAGFVLDNGSGLSRHARVSAQWLAQLLQHAWSSPVMPELMSSLPVSGLDGTLRRTRASAGRAHLKTGSLRDAAGVAGYVLADSGRRYVLVAMINHPQANTARAVLDALAQWAIREAGSR